MQVGREGDIAEAGLGKEFGDRFLLAVADFQNDEPAGRECHEGLGDEAAVDGETIRACKESLPGLEVADFGGEAHVVGLGDVWRVGDDDLILLACNGCKQVPDEKANSVGDSICSRVLTG